MIDVKTILSLNVIENDGGSIISSRDYQLEKNKFLKKQYNGLKANVTYASKIFARNNESARIYFVFTDKNEVNGYVSRLRNYQHPRYLIACYAGIFVYTQNLFLWLMSSADILPDIGRRTEKRNVRFHELSDFFTSKRRIALSRLSTPFVLVGPDKMDNLSNDLRNQYALLLTSLATEFLFFHEMTHVEHGHVDFLYNNISRFNALYSTDNHQKTAVQAFDKIRGIENEADIGAAEYLYDAYWNLEYRGTLMKPFSKLLKSNNDLLFALFYSLLWLFHLVQEYRILSGNKIVSSHPAPGCRILSIYGIFYILAKNKKGDPEGVDQQFLNAVRAYTSACETVQIDPFVTPDIFANNSPDRLEFLEVEELRLEMLHELKPYHFHRKD